MLYLISQLEIIWGCMDDSAHNYDPDADIDDGSCIYGPDIISIYDAPNDEGGHVYLNWSANSIDSAGSYPSTRLTAEAECRNDPRPPSTRRQERVGRLSNDLSIRMRSGSQSTTFATSMNNFCCPGSFEGGAASAGKIALALISPRMLILSNRGWLTGLIVP